MIVGSVVEEERVYIYAVDDDGGHVREHFGKTSVDDEPGRREGQ